MFALWWLHERFTANDQKSTLFSNYLDICPYWKWKFCSNFFLFKSKSCYPPEKICFESEEIKKTISINHKIFSPSSTSFLFNFFLNFTAILLFNMLPLFYLQIVELTFRVGQMEMLEKRSIGNGTLQNCSSSLLNTFYWTFFYFFRFPSNNFPFNGNGWQIECDKKFLRFLLCNFLWIDKVFFLCSFWFDYEIKMNLSWHLVMTSLIKFKYFWFFDTMSDVVKFMGEEKSLLLKRINLI